LSHHSLEFLKDAGYEVLARDGARRLAPNTRAAYVGVVKNPLECVDSTVAPSALVDVVRDAYGIGAAARCELIQRHLDATYLMSEGEKQHVVRLYNARWWTRQDVEGEVDVLRHLAARGIRVGAPVQRKDGGWVTSVPAPEGERQLLLYEYLEGEGLVPSRDAGRFGELVGRMHRALEGCVVSRRRRELTFRGLTEDTFDAIISQLAEESEHRRYLEDLRARVSTRAEAVGLSSFREGLCHGDLNFSNAVRQADGQIGLYDFECCGVGLLAYDLGVFRWTQQWVGAPEQSWQDFLDGYRSTNVLPDRELAGMDLLVLLRQLYMFGHDARRTRIESLGTRWRRARWPAQMDALRKMDARLFGTPVDQRW
jgi:Ser/Thr protein kinase RdoA (MazF antagonist)